MQLHNINAFRLTPKVLNARWSKWTGVPFRMACRSPMHVTAVGVLSARNTCDDKRQQFLAALCMHIRVLTPILGQDLSKHRVE